MLKLHYIFKFLINTIGVIDVPISIHKPFGIKTPCDVEFFNVDRNRVFEGEFKRTAELIFNEGSLNNFYFMIISITSYALRPKARFLTFKIVSDDAFSKSSISSRFNGVSPCEMLFIVVEISSNEDFIFTISGWNIPDFLILEFSA